MSARGGKELPFGEKCVIMAADSQASEVSHEKETIVPRLRARADDLSAPRRTGAGGRRHARRGGPRIPRSCDRHRSGLRRRGRRDAGAGRRAARASARRGESRKGRPPQLRLGRYSLLGAERGELLCLSWPDRLERIPRRRRAGCRALVRHAAARARLRL